MDIVELENKFGTIPSHLDRKKVETLLKKRDNVFPQLSLPLINSVEEWLNENELKWDRIDIPYDTINATTEHLIGIKIDKLIILIVDDYSKFNTTVVRKNIAGKIHFKLIEDGYRVVWCKKFEWENPRKRTVMKSLILHVLGKTPKKYYARNTICEIVESRTLKSFFEESSFYGNRSASQAVALKDKNTGEVLSALTFGNCYYGRDKYGENVVECIRSAGKPFTVVVGGMTKLLKFYIKNFGDNIDNIVFYCDDAHYHSSSMDSTKFKFHHFSGNGTHNVWVDTGAMFMRTPALHKEIMYMQKIGQLYAIPDVGSSTFLYNVKSDRENEQ